ncbi:MAG: His/Gly/Thr/Pro-type tRNA ligase C-terminal domain-containing protein, partial [Pseudomonadota bacterium]|nr:His/Gly/Thr/Pro-type tRNA ligase C-terminal domain-containing protein [Pseudomonadota bacterium]
VKEVSELIGKFGIKVQPDLRNEKIGFKIRDHTIQKIPYLLVAGDREVERNSISVRYRNGSDLGNMSVEEFTSIVNKKIVNRSLEEGE